jgi:phage repressor protein C with HTH and peptisase S24 domain
MMKTFSEAFQEAVRSTGRSVREVSATSGVSYEQLKKAMQGKTRSMNADDAVRVARAFGVTVEELLAGRFSPTAPTPLIAVAGRVSAGDRVQLVDAFEKGEGLFQVECPPGLHPRGIVAVEVKGDSMSPIYQNGHVLFYSRLTAEGVLEEDLGRPCIAEDVDGHAWVKQVKRGSEPGLFHLISLNPESQNLWNVKLKWASRVILALPSEMIRAH